MNFLKKMNAVEDSIIPWVGKTSKMIDFFLQENFKNKGIYLSKEQVVVLKILHRKDGVNQNELAFLTLRDKSTLTRLLSKMESKDLIKRQRSKEDKRVSQVFLTQEGKNVYEKAEPILLEFLDILGEDITQEEKEITTKVLKKIQLNMDIKSKSL